jgi:hypothetical protein
MEWLRLLAPSAAVLSLFLAVALIVQSIRHGRAIRRLEGRIEEGDGAASRASLERIAALQARSGTSTGAPRPPRTRMLVIGAAVLAAVLVVVAGTWWFLGREDEPATAQQTETNQQASAEGTTSGPPPDGTSVPEDQPPLQNKSQYEIAVLNASGVSLAARDKVQPQVVAEGYTGGYIGDAPDGTSDLETSIVMYTDGNKQLGFQLAEDLGVERAIPLEGLTPDQIEGADAVVIIGQDLAS